MFPPKLERGGNSANRKTFLGHTIPAKRKSPNFRPRILERIAHEIPVTLSFTPVEAYAATTTSYLFSSECPDETELG